MNKISNIANYFIEEAESLALEIVEEVIERQGLNIPDWEKQQAVNMYIGFMGFLGTTLKEGLNDQIPAGLVSWSKENGEREARSGGRISDIIIRYPATRKTFSRLAGRLAEQYGLSVDQTIFLLGKINLMLDISLNETLFAFERISDQLAAEMQRELAELSAPIVPIREGVAVLPLVGSIDSYRAHYIMEKVIPRIPAKQIEYLITDFSGLLNIDLDVARHLFQIESVLSLLGITTVITGLRPKLAQAAVLGGIELTRLRSFATVRHAVEHLEKHGDTKLKRN